MSPEQRVTRASAKAKTGSVLSSPLSEPPRSPGNVTKNTSNKQQEDAIMMDAPTRPEEQIEDQQEEQAQETEVQPVQPAQERQIITIPTHQALVIVAKDQRFQAPIALGDRTLYTLQEISDYVESLPEGKRYEAQVSIGERLHEIYTTTNEVTRQFLEEVQEKKYYIVEGKSNQAFEADFEDLKESVKSARSAAERADSAFRKLEKLITGRSSNRLAEALKYVKAEFPNAGHTTWSKFSSLITLGEDPRTVICRINDEIYRGLTEPVKYAHNDVLSLRSKHFQAANSKVGYAFAPLQIDTDVLLKAGLGYHASGLLVLGTQNMVFPEFEDEKPSEAMEEGPKPDLSTKKVYEIDDEGNEIRDDLVTPTKQRKRPREDDTSFPESRTLKKQALESTRRTDALERQKQVEAQREKLTADQTMLAMQLDFANAGRHLPPNLGEGMDDEEDVFGAPVGSPVGSPVYKGSRAPARLTPSKQKLETPVLALPDTEGDYDVKEITRNELNERTSIRTRFLKQSCNCVMPKDWLAVFEDPEFEMTSFEKHRESLLQPLFQIENSGNLPCLEHCKAIFKRFKLRPLHSSNSKAYVYVLLKILHVTSTQEGKAARLSVAARSPLTAMYFMQTEKVRKVQKGSLGLLRFKPTGDVSWKKGIEKSDDLGYYLHQEVLDLNAFAACGYVHTERLFRFLHEDSELRKLLAEEMNIYEWHYRKSATSGDTSGLIRIMWNTIGQQLVRQHPLNYFAHLRLRTDQATALYAFPTLLRYLKKGEAVVDSRYQGDSQLLKNGREHGIIDLVPFYPEGTCPKSKPESVVKEPEGPGVLAGGLSIVRKWLLESNVSRSDVSLNDEYDSEGASLVRAIVEATDETIEGERVCRWDHQRQAPGEALYLKSGVPVSFDYTPEHDQAWFSSGLVAEDLDRPGFLENGVSVNVWRQHMLDMTPPPQFRFSDGVDYCSASLLPQVRLEGLGPISQALIGFSSWSEQDVVEEVEKFKEGNRMAGTAYSNWEKRAISQAKAAIKKFKKREEAMFGDVSYQRRQEKEAELPEDEDSLSDTDDLVLPFSVSQPTGNSELGEEIQHAPALETPQAGGVSPIPPSVEALTPEAEETSQGDLGAATSEPDLYSAEG
jgi:hypothetical protein